MKERPILFSGEMVRAILDGRKTQTRRVIVERKIGVPASIQVDGSFIYGVFPASPFPAVKYSLRCPFGQPGDRLWVRESFRCAGVHESDGHRPHFHADAAGTEDALHKWKPSIHMPRWASRITLEVAAVRVERIQEIGGQDAIAEGIERRDDYYLGGPHRYVKGKTKVFSLAWQAYKDVWNHLNAKRGYGWDINPWVWVVDFNRYESTYAKAKALALNAYGGRQM